MVLMKPIATYCRELSIGLMASLCGRPLCIFTLRLHNGGMESQLDLAIGHGLHDSDEEEEDMMVECLLSTSDSLELDEESRRRLEGSMLKRLFVHHDREGGANRLFHNYFIDDLVFDDNIFWCKYRMQRDVFLCFVHVVITFDS